MTRVESTFDTGANGSDVLTTDPGSPTAFDVRSVTSGSIKYDSSVTYGGALSAKFSFSNVSAQTYLRWTTATGSLTNHYGRAYLYATSYPATTVGDHAPFGFIQTSFSNGPAVRVHTTGVLELDDGAFIGTLGSVPIALNQWIRIEWHVIHLTSGGLIEAKLFNNPTSTAPDEWIIFSNRNTGVDCGKLQLGSDNSGSGWIFWLDNVVAGATDWVGPVPEIQTLLMQHHVFGHGVW